MTWKGKAELDQLASNGIAVVMIVSSSESVSIARSEVRSEPGSGDSEA